MKRVLITMLLSLAAAQARGESAVLEAEVLEGARVVLPGSSSGDEIGYLVLHHKQQKDQARLSAWLRQHSGIRVEFQTSDGNLHEGVLQRLKHCFGRGLLLYRDAIALKGKDVIRLRLDADK